MRYIETWLTGLGLEYIIPKLKAQGITTPKKLAALSLRDIYEVVGVEDTEDRKKLYFLIRRLKSILKSKGGDVDDEEEEEEELAEEPKEDSPTTQQKSIPTFHKPNQRTEYIESKPAPEHEIVPALSKTPPVEKQATNNIAIPETAESQEDLRRLRLHHRRQVQTATTAGAAEIEKEVVVQQAIAEVEEQEETVTSKATAARVTHSTQLSVAPITAAKQPQQQPQASVPQSTTTNVERKPASRLTRLASRQIPPVSTPEDDTQHDNASNIPGNTAPSAVSQRPPLSNKTRPQTAPAPTSHSNIKQNVTAQSMENWQSSAPPAPPTSSSFFTSDDEENNNNNITDYTNATLRVVVRKRPLGQHEIHRGERDIIDIGENGVLVVRDIKTKVDLTKVWQSIPFQFDDAFADYDSNRTIYDNCLRSLLPHVLSEGMKVSCFTYGQTGSGKTYTMFGTGDHSHATGNHANNGKGLDNEGDRFGLYHLCMADVLHMIQQSAVLSSSIRVYLTCFEIYGEKLFDLLNNRTLVKNMEDAKQHVRIVGLTEHEVTDLDSFQRLLHIIVASRSTSSTGANHDSSRSHQVLEVSFKYYNSALIAAQQAANAAGSISRRPKNPMAMIPPSQLPAAVMGKIVFVDLAGSEKAADTFMNAKSTRMEGADINTSLLALKEVFRSMEKKNGYMPFRGSKLTQVLKESLQGKSVRTCMIACVSPATSHYEQTMNTLRYAAKVYEVTAGSGAAGGTEIEEAPFVNPQDDHRIVYTAADFQEMKNAADVLAHHSSKHTNNNSCNSNNNNRAVSAPRGGAATTSNNSNNQGTRARSGSQSATSASNNASNTNNTNSNRRISTSGLPKPSNSNNHNNSNQQAVNEVRQLPLSRFLSSDDDYQQQPPNNNNNNSYYTAEDEALPSSKLRITNTNSSRLRAPATSHISITHAQPEGNRPLSTSLQRRNSFASHTSTSNNNKNTNNTVVVNDDAQQIMSPPVTTSNSGKQLKRSISSVMPSSTSTQIINNGNNNNLVSGLPRPKSTSSNSMKSQIPTTPQPTTRKALPDYPESSDAYEEDEEKPHTSHTRHQHQQHYHHQKQIYRVEPLENSYYASQAHETMESYLQENGNYSNDSDDGEYEDDGGENIALDMNDGDNEEDEGEAGDDEHDPLLNYQPQEGDNEDIDDHREDDNDKTEELQMTWGLLSAHKLSIAEMVEVMKEEMELVQRMENVDERDTDDYLDTLQAILTAKSLAVMQLRQELQMFQEFRAEQRLFR